MRRARLSAIPRLSRTTLRRLLETRARIVRRRVVQLIHDGTTLGSIEKTIWTGRQVSLRGWSSSGDLTAGFAGRRRHRLSQTDGFRENRVKFTLDLDRPDASASLVFRLEMSGEHEVMRISAPTRLSQRTAQFRALPGALIYTLSHLPNILRFLRTADPGLSVVLRDAFGLSDDPTAPLVSPDIFAPPQPSAAPDAPVVILIPVHNAADDLGLLLDRLTETVDIDHRILLVDDASDDPAIAPMLEAFGAADPGRRPVERLARNLGFVGAVNHGLALARQMGGHVILLNTDTLPPKDWAGRLLAPILSDASVASVTPLSNTAEIASIPAQHIETPLSPHDIDRIDDVAKRFGRGWRDVTLPTGIGFAMALNRAFLDRIGAFDTAFGRGYGEEVDWCQKARASGGRHVLATSLFVGHKGGASFGTGEKSRRVQAAARLISDRYPTYDLEVQEWAQCAPHAVQRIALTLSWLATVSPAPVPVFLGHLLGGGAEMALRREIDAILATGAPGVVILRAGGTTEWRMEIEGDGFTHRCRIDDSETVLALLAPLSDRRIVYSCGVGARDATAVPKMLQVLAQDARHSLELRLHDYFVISPSYCLLDATGRYSGPPEEGTIDPAHQVPGSGANVSVTLVEWQSLWSNVIGRADTVVAFSSSSAALIAQAYPFAASKVSIKPHDLPDDMPRQVRSAGRHIGILGGLNRAKGADVLVSLACCLNDTAATRRLVLIGDLDPNYRLPPPHKVNGRYDRSDIAHLTERHDIGLWLIPSVWPETFSFTTREALATGLPVLTFDLGAQAEAAHAARNGHVLTAQPDDIAAIATEIENAFAQLEDYTETKSRSVP